MVLPLTKYSRCLYGNEIFVPVGGIMHFLDRLREETPTDKIIRQEGSQAAHIF
jgi:hypothetical protein